MNGTGSVAGITGMTMSGTGTVMLGTANTFTGQTDLTAGTLILAHANALQNSTLNNTGGTLVFDSSVVANAFTLGGLAGSQAIALQNNAGSPLAVAVTVGNNNASTTYSGNLSGAGSLIKAGSGTLTLTGDLSGLSGAYTNQAGITVMNSTPGLTGAVSVTGGELQLTSTANSLGAASSVTVAGGILRFDNATTTNYSVNSLTAGSNVFINNGSTLSLTTGTLNFGTTASVIQSTGTTGKLTSGAVSGNLTLTANTALIDEQIKVQIVNNGATAVNLVKNGGGQVTLQNANTYTGTTTVGNGVLVANNSAAFGTGAVTLGNGGTAQVYLGNGVNTANALTIASNNASFAGALQARGTDTATWSGPIAITAAQSSGGHFSSDPGALLNLTGAITSASVPVIHRNGNVVYSGGGSYATLQVTGTAKVGANNGIATNASVTIGNSGNAILDLNGFSQTLTGVTKGTGGTATISNTGATASTLTLTNTGAVTYAGTIVNGTGGVSLVQSGAGTTTLTGANTYTGNTTVNAGTLSLSSAYLADASTVNIAATGATLDLNYIAVDTVNQLFLGGVLQVPGTWGSLASSAAHKDARITGTGILSVTTGALNSPFDLWATSKGLTTGNNGKADNPDNDGVNNLGEFALNGNPLSGVSDGKVVSRVVTLGGSPVLTLTLPVRTGAVFTAPTSTELVSAVVDGVIYHIQGGNDLTTFGLAISEITDPGDVATVQGTLATDHPLDSGWAYRSFRAPGTATTDPTAFLRAKITE